MGWNKLSLPWKECNEQNDDEHKFVMDCDGLVVGATNWVNQKMDLENRQTIIKSVNNFPGMLEALGKVIVAYQDTGIVDGDRVAFAMHHADMMAVLKAYEEACRATETSPC